MQDLRCRRPDQPDQEAAARAPRPASTEHILLFHAVWTNASDRGGAVRGPVAGGGLPGLIILCAGLFMLNHDSTRTSPELLGTIEDVGGSPILEQLNPAIIERKQRNESHL